MSALARREERGVEPPVEEAQGRREPELVDLRERQGVELFDEEHRGLAEAHWARGVHREQPLGRFVCVQRRQADRPLRRGPGSPGAAWHKLPLALSHESSLAEYNFRKV